MSADTWWDIATLLIGITVGFLGVYAYVGRGAPEFFGRARLNGPLLIGRSIIIALKPFGIGIVLIGIALLIGKNAVTSGILVAGLGVLLLGWLLFFIHPRVIQPKWLRDDPLFGSSHRHTKEPGRRGSQQETRN